MILSGYVTFYQINKFFVNLLIFIIDDVIAGWIWPAGHSLETPVWDYCRNTSFIVKWSLRCYCYANTSDMQAMLAPTEK